MDMPIDYQLKKKKELEEKEARAAKKDAQAAGLLDLSGHKAAGSLSEAIERQAAVQRKIQQDSKTVVDAEDPYGGGPGISTGPTIGSGGGGADISSLIQQVQSNPITDMLASLMDQFNSIKVNPTPLDQLRKQAESQVAAQFDPVIASLTQQMNATKRRGGESQAEARSMYNALGQDFANQLPEITNQFAQQDAATNQRYDNAQKQLQDMYGQQSQQQSNVLRSLGIQAAAPDAAAQANTDQKYFQGQMESEQQSALDALAQQEMAQRNYQQNLGNSSRMAGENTAQDIGRQLEDYLSQAGTQMTGLQGQRGSAMSSLLQQLQSQDAQRVQQSEQQQFQNLMALSGMQMDAAGMQQNADLARMQLQGQMQMNNADNEAALQRAIMQMQADAQNKQSEIEQLFKGTSGNSGAMNYLNQQYPDQPIMASNLMALIDQVAQNEDVVRGKYELTPAAEDGSRQAVFADVDQNYMNAILRRLINEQNAQNPGRYNSNDITNAIDALMAISGRLR